MERADWPGYGYPKQDSLVESLGNTKSIVATVWLFLRNNDVGPAIRPKLLEILADTQKRNLLRTELAAVVDLGEHFV